MTGASTMQRLAAEGLGTALLLTAVVGSGIMGETLSGGNVAVALLANSLATGAALIVLIIVLGPLSGAHFNPAVSIVFAIRGEMPASMTVAYVAAQVAGAVLGVWAAHAMFDLPILELSSKIRTGAPQWIAEAIATFGLVLTILGTLRSRAEAVPFTVGLYIVAAYWFTASTSFANPAVTIARSMTETFAGIAPQGVVPFILAQFCGALLGWGATIVLFRDTVLGRSAKEIARNRA